jgi:hypothetical protein
MSDGVKIASIIALALVISTFIYVYFSPYQSCMRNTDRSEYVPEVVCANLR